MKVEFELNGDPVAAEVDPGAPLREVLREEFDRTDVKVGCLSGRCGVCTVHLDGTAVKSCLVLAAKADGRSVTTAAGLADDGDGLHPVQEAFVEGFAAQCGYCTPGFVMRAADYLEDAPDDPSREEIREALKGNVCRCTGYVKIVDAVERVLDGREGTGETG